MVLGSQLKLILKKRDISVAQLARATKISSKTIYHWLNGQSPRNLNQLKSVSEFLKVDLNYLLFAESRKIKNEFEDYQDEIKAGVFEVILRKIKHIEEQYENV